MMRKMIFAFLVLIAAVAQLLGAQQSSSTPSASAHGATVPGPVHSNITYGMAGGETLLLDIFEPANNSGKSRPAVVLVHGGGWTNFDKSTMRALAQFLALAGFVAVPVDYRLFHDDATRWPAQLDDVQRAVRWLRANSSKYNIDADHIGAFGHSAGAQLAALLGMEDTRDNSDPALARYSSRVEAVVDVSGPSDFTTGRDADSDPFFTTFFGGDYEHHPEIWQEESPIFHVSKKASPFLIVQGTRDDTVPIAQAQDLADKLKRARVHVE